MKQVQIIRREAKSHLPVPVRANSVKTLASIFSEKGPLKGVDGEEEERLLSQLLQKNPKEPDFHKSCREYWIDLRVKVYSEGKVLNISKDEKGNPLNIEDYLIYKWAKRHKLVANDKEEMERDSLKQFYIRDPEIEEKRQNKTVKTKRDAYKEFTKIAEKPDKMKMLIQVLSDADVDSMSPTQIENYIEELIEDNPSRFVKVVTDKSLEMKAFLVKLISANIIRKIGNSIYFGEEKLGDTMDDTVTYLNDKKNSETYLMLKEKLKAEDVN